MLTPMAGAQEEPVFKNSWREKPYSAYFIGIGEYSDVEGLVVPKAISHTIEQFLRSFTGLQQADDEALLGRFIAARDGQAFTEIVRRHGVMVFGVAKRLVQYVDAEDAFQTVFLHLARQASSVRGNTLAAWLHRVTVRVAAEAQTVASLETTDIVCDNADPFAEVAWRKQNDCRKKEKGGGHEQPPRVQA